MRLFTTQRGLTMKESGPQRVYSRLVCIRFVLQSFRNSSFKGKYLHTCYLSVVLSLTICILHLPLMFSRCTNNYAYHLITFKSALAELLSWKPQKTFRIKLYLDKINVILNFEMTYNNCSSNSNISTTSQDLILTEIQFFTADKKYIHTLHWPLQKILLFNQMLPCF